MKILVPVDGSAHSFKALEAASALARNREAEIYVISVTSLIGSMEDHEISPDMRERHEKNLQKIADEAIESACEVLRNEQINIKSAQTLSTTLSIPEAVVDFAKAQKIDLIVLGSRGLSASTRFKLGSIAYQVVKSSPCSVHLVKIPAEQD